MENKKKPRQLWNGRRVNADRVIPGPRLQMHSFVLNTFYRASLLFSALFGAEDWVFSSGLEYLTSIYRLSLQSPAP